jgi:hypothetical protein
MCSVGRFCGLLLSIVNLSAFLRATINPPRSSSQSEANLYGMAMLSDGILFISEIKDSVNFKHAREIVDSDRSFHDGRSFTKNQNDSNVIYGNLID